MEKPPNEFVSHSCFRRSPDVIRKRSKVAESSAALVISKFTGGSGMTAGEVGKVNNGIEIREVKSR